MNRGGFTPSAGPLFRRGYSNGGIRLKAGGLILPAQ
jgi:hypothetical protein